MNKHLAALVACAWIGAWYGSVCDHRDATPSESPSPERQVIPLGAEAPSTAKPAQEVGPIVDLAEVEQAIKREAGRMYYSDFDAAGKVAAETGRPLVLVVAPERPDYQPPTNITFCYRAANIPGAPDSYQPPYALLFRSVTFDDRTPPVRLDLENLESSIAQNLEPKQ